MRVFVVQRLRGNLDAIRSAVEAQGIAHASSIAYLRSAQEVALAIQEIPTGATLVVVSGSVLRYGSSSYDGIYLARAVKRSHPQALCFSYSVMPAQDAAIDGVIPKKDGTLCTGDHDCLVRFLAVLRDGVTLADLRAAVPEIRSGTP
ncbi:hypothetical protein HYV74_05150 [Candidatus Uhrbacteria bacterium]|nr:hypothetical protein [Candidatus Uhrbacteria bacterium]